MNCHAANRSRPTLFFVVVALSAVAFVGQALAASATDDTIAVASLAAASATPR